MTARTAVAIASLAVALPLAGCASFYEIPVETPIQAKIDVGAFQRILVAGFLNGGSQSIDANTVHGSDSLENAGIEIAQFYTEDQIVG